MIKEYKVYSNATFRIVVFFLERNGYRLKEANLFHWVYSNGVDKVFIYAEY